MRVGHRVRPERRRASLFCNPSRAQEPSGAGFRFWRLANYIRSKFCSLACAGHGEQRLHDPHLHFDWARAAHAIQTGVWSLRVLLALSTCVDDALDIGEDGASRFCMRLAPTSFPGFNPVSARLVSHGNLSDMESRAATSAAICLRDCADQPRRVFCDARGNVLVEGATHAVLLTSDGRVRTEERQIVEAAPNTAELVGDTMPNLPEQTLPEEPGDVAEVVFVDGGLELQVNGEAVEFEPCDTDDPEDTERAYTQLIAGLAAQGFEVDESYDGEMPDDEYEMDDEEDDEEEMDAEYADESLDEADMEVAKTILQQLGGKQFQMMTGAKNLVADENSLKFKIGSNAKRVGYVRIQLDPDDTYTVQFMSSSGKLMKEFDMIYADQLQSVFTDYTGMYTRLF